MNCEVCGTEMTLYAPHTHKCTKCGTVRFISRIRKEVQGDIWSFWRMGFFIVIPTNGFIKKNGCNAMGKGLALHAKNRFPDLPELLGNEIREFGNVVICFEDMRIITFPTKRRWYEKASLGLIENSCIGLISILNEKEIKTPIYIPKVGCGYGNLDWRDVKPILERYLDSRFVIVNHPRREEEK